MRTKRNCSEESARLRHDWEREKPQLEATLQQLRLLHSQAPSSGETKNAQEKAALLEKSICLHMEEQERILRSLERNNCILRRLEKISAGEAVVREALKWLDFHAYGFLSDQDIDHLIIFDDDTIIDSSENLETFSSKQSSFRKIIVELKSVLTDWQIAADRIIERELLVSRRIGSLCFLSGENGFLGLKLATMIRVGLLEANPDRAKLLLKLQQAWKFWNIDHRLQIGIGRLHPTQLITKYSGIFDAIFLDSEVLSFWAQEYSSCYLDIIKNLESAFPFFIFLLKENQVALHSEAMHNMEVEIHSLASVSHEEEISTLLIARRKSRYILHYAWSPWDTLVRDFTWNNPSSLDSLPVQNAKNFPHPFHLPEKILLSSQFAARVVANSMDNGMQSKWFNQREITYWRKFGGQIPELPRLLSEERTEREWKIILGLGVGNWVFARGPYPTEHMLGQARSLLQVLSWLRERSIFLNNIRRDNLAIDGSAIRILSLERLDTFESEDTLSSLLWIWYDLGSHTPPFRSWPIEYFPEENLAHIPEPLQKFARIAVISDTVDCFLKSLL